MTDPKKLLRMITNYPGLHSEQYAEAMEPRPKSIWQMVARLRQQGKVFYHGYVTHPVTGGRRVVVWPMKNQDGVTNELEYGRYLRRAVKREEGKAA